MQRVNANGKGQCGRSRNGNSWRENKKEGAGDGCQEVRAEKSTCPPGYQAFGEKGHPFDMCTGESGGWESNRMLLLKLGHTHSS